MVDNNFASPAHISEDSLLQPTIQAWKIFLKDQGRSKYTIKAFVADLALLESYIAPDKTIGLITTKDLEGFTTWLEKERNVPCSPKSLSRRITAVKSFFRWLHQNAALPADPADKLVQLSVKSPLPVVLTENELTRVLEVVEKIRVAENPDARPYVLINLILQTAIKKGECISLTLNHLDLESPNGPSIFVRYTNPRYRYKERNIDLSNEWVEAFNEYNQQYQLTKEVFPWSPRRLEYILEDIGEAAGLEKHLSFDMCRWTSVLRDLIGQVEPDLIRQKLGISKIQWREIHMKLRTLAFEQGVDLDQQITE
ncbi:MAG: site-specific integrase [Anaerolineaceae bacterium]|nr:site-specific integrase [Anaerolineaceae bacterium]